MDNMYKGKLKQWNEDKGFGFIRSENAKRDIFIHISALKNMSRKPIVGDVISYQIHTDNDGKNRAVNARIEGVAIVRKQVKRDVVTRRRTHSPNPFPKLLFYGILIFSAFFFYNNFFKKKNSLVVNSSPVVFAPKQVKQNFKCDGREHCSQMNSRAEAVFFIRNCPNTKMDGDYDGIPCENDSRF